MLDAYKWLALVASAFFLIFGFFSYLRNKKEASNKVFGFLYTAFFIWCFSWFLMLSVKENEHAALLWARFLNFGALWIPVIYFHWIINYLDLYKTKLIEILLFACYLFTIVFSLFSFSNLYVSGVHSEFFFPFWPTAGVLFKWFLLFGYFGMILSALFLLIKNFFLNQGEKRSQIAYIIVGSLLDFAGGLINFLLMYGINDFHYFFAFVGMILVVASTLVLSYAVVKHRLMNFRFLGVELLSVFLVAVIFIDVLMARSKIELILKLSLFLAVLLLGYVLARSLLSEIKSREKLEEMAETLRVANVELQKLDKAKSEFLNIASHQLRTPISVIKGITSMMIEGDLEKMPPEKKQVFIRGIWEKSQKLESIINDILNAAEMTNQEYTAKIKQEDHFDAVILLKEIIEGFQPLVKEREIDLTLNTIDESILISGEKEYLREALSNLIDNAIKYTPSTGANSESRDKRNERGKIIVTMKKDSHNVIIEITDNGMGIPAKEIPELFKKFSRASNARNMYTDGSGLGLFIVKEIIEGHGGKINLSSEIGKGTTFHIKLPLHTLRETDMKRYIIDKQQV